VLVDSDVLIWASRGNEKAVALLDKQEEFSISAVTYMELIQGMRNKTELASFKKALYRCARKWFPPTSGISRQYETDFARDIPVNNAPTRPGPFVTATSLISSRRLRDRSSAAVRTSMMYST